MHVGIANPLWRGKRSRCMRNPQFCVSGKRAMNCYRLFSSHCHIGRSPAGLLAVLEGPMLVRVCSLKHHNAIKISCRLRWLKNSDTHPKVVLPDNIMGKTYLLSLEHLAGEISLVVVSLRTLPRGELPPGFCSFDFYYAWIIPIVRGHPSYTFSLRRCSQYLIMYVRFWLCNGKCFSCSKNVNLNVIIHRNASLAWHGIYIRHTCVLRHLWSSFISHTCTPHIIRSCNDTSLLDQSTCLSMQFYWHLNNVNTRTTNCPNGFTNREVIYWTNSTIRAKVCNQIFMNTNVNSSIKITQGHV